MRMRVMAGVGVVAMVTAAAAGQQAPDFSGTWRVAKGATSTIAAAPSPVFGEVFAMRQRGQRVELIRSVRGRETAVVHAFPIDGSEQRAMSPSRACLADSGTVSSMAWDGPALVYTLVASIAPGGAVGAPIGLKYTFRLEAPDRLVIETTMRDSASGQPRAVASVYQKSTDVLTEASAPPVAGAKATIADVSWIAGHWVGGTAPSAIEERWTPPAGGSMLAISRTIRNGALTAFEFLCISERESTLVYTALPNGQGATDFTLTKFDAESATFENPAHSFPKVIRYAKRPDGSMEAAISGAPGSKPTTFVFKRQEPK